jgi:hypothetical protein
MSGSRAQLGVAMGDKSPKSKNKAKKQHDAVKKEKRDALSVKQAPVTK